MPKDTYELAIFLEVLQSFPMVFPVWMIFPMEFHERKYPFLWWHFPCSSHEYKQHTQLHSLNSLTNLTFLQKCHHYIFTTDVAAHAHSFSALTGHANHVKTRPSLSMKAYESRIASVVLCKGTIHVHEHNLKDA